jgi:hypothetical protein
VSEGEERRRYRVGRITPRRRYRVGRIRARG